MNQKKRSIEGYIANLTDNGQLKAEQIRAIIRRCVPACQETIKYGMPAFQLDGKSFIYFAVWKKHVGIYPIYRGDDAFERAIAPYRAEKDTVQFARDERLPMGIIETIVLAQAKRHQT